MAPSPSSSVVALGVGLVLLATTSQAQSVVATTAPASEALKPAAATAPPAMTPVAPAKRSEIIVLTVDKSNLRAELKTWPEDFKQASTLRTFKIAIGKAEGDKEVEGDNKTPEGVYFAQSHIPGQSLPEKYGTLAIPIDFPNPMDRIFGKTGHGIWLHGVERDERVEEAKVTEGCVAFYNSDIARLSAWLRSHQGVVVIANDTTRVNEEADVLAVQALTQQWMRAWADRRIDDYISLYAPDFRFERHDLASYKSYKRRVFDQYKVMTVAYDGLRVITHQKYAVSFFNQDFHGDSHFQSIGRKILYWERLPSGGWAIKREVFESRRFENVTFTEAELALLSETTSGISSNKEDKKPEAPNL